MRILYLDHPEADFLAAIVYMGLAGKLGPENVIDFPYKHTYHGETYVGPVPCHTETGVGTAAPFPWMRASPPIDPNARWSEDKIVAEIRSFDLVILASPRAYNTQALERIQARVGHLPNIVMLDGEDYTTIRWDLVERFQPRVYFKLSAVARPHEVYHAAKARMANKTRVVPFPLGSPLEAVEPLPKDLDVAFLGGNNWRKGDRAALAARLECEFGAVTKQLGYGEYIETLRRARVAVCVGGHGLEPLRTFETLACPGTLLLRERIDVLTPYPFNHGETCLLWDSHDIDSLVAIVRNILRDEPRRQIIASAGNQYSDEHFTPSARARDLMTEAFR